MQISAEKCVLCEACVVYCPVDAIDVSVSERQASIDEDRCVECSVCSRSEVCPEDAFYQPELEWPRVLRARFSDPLMTHPDTGIWGRGTAEMKTNDVTGRYRLNEAGLLIELGRPGISTTMSDVEKITTSLAPNVEFEPLNPLTALLDPRTGSFRDPSIRSERVLSAIIECTAKSDDLVRILKLLEELAGGIDTVFSVGVISRCVNGEIPLKPALEKAGFVPRINGKTNVGLGRPLA